MITRDASRTRSHMHAHTLFRDSSRLWPRFLSVPRPPSLALLYTLSHQVKAPRRFVCCCLSQPIFSSRLFLRTAAHDVGGSILEASPSYVGLLRAPNPPQCHSKLLALCSCLLGRSEEQVACSGIIRRFTVCGPSRSKKINTRLLSRIFTGKCCENRSTGAGPIAMGMTGVSREKTTTTANRVTVYCIQMV